MYGVLYQYSPWVVSLFVFGLILVFLWLGGVYRRYHIRRGIGSLKEGWGALENAMLTLLGLLLAFTFGMALTKFESRRQLLVEEANDIGTAILRCDLYPDSTRRVLRNDFQQYVETRINYYKAGSDQTAIQQALDEGTKYSKHIWELVMIDAKNPGNFIRANQMVPALNAVIDIVSTREAERNAKVPRLILVTLLLLTTTGSFLIGYDQSRAERARIFVLGFAFMITLTIYLILELDRPKVGLINLHAAEKMIEDLRLMFND